MVLAEIVSGLEGLKAAKEFCEAVSPHLAGLIRSPSDRFLNYDPAFLLRDAYSRERSIDNGGIPYTEICDFSKLVELKDAWDDTKVELQVKGKFIRDTGGTLWQPACSAGFTALRDSKRILANEETIRVSKADINYNEKKEPKSLSLTLEKATYFDLAHSNLILDFDRDKPNSHTSLRTQLLSQRECDCRLPPLDEPRLANTLGIACLLFYWERNAWIPYLVKRVRDLAVFPGGVHCTASGVASWPEKPETETLENFVTKHMLAELDEEVGLKPEDLIDFRPVSLCREMARGGKPQLFYSGFIYPDRTRYILRERRKNAASKVKLPEVERDGWWSSADVVLHPNGPMEQIHTIQFTHEGAASLFLGYRYAFGGAWERVTDMLKADAQKKTRCRIASKHNP